MICDRQCESRCHRTLPVGFERCQFPIKKQKNAEIYTSKENTVEKFTKVHTKRFFIASNVRF